MSNGFCLKAVAPFPIRRFSIPGRQSNLATFFLGLKWGMDFEIYKRPDNYFIADAFVRY
jgi:hypothetical protein